MARDVTDLLRDKRLNALGGWIIVVVLFGVAVTSLVGGNLLWTVFATTVTVLAVLPPVLLVNRYAMLPWEILLLAALPVVGRLFATVPVTGNLASYLSVAAIALIIAVELHVFTPVRMTPRFAVVFVAVATMAAAGGWAVVRWGADIMLGTTFVLDPALTEHEIEEALMWEFVASTIAGLGAGLVFAYYVRRQIGTKRIPREVRPDT
ncbi:hypothetical protein ACFQJ5_12255 [Halomicroarcula sp. GCM10025324]|uniref:hypothetical protein n=1 Tax=Haloarcula TaxID=2237 RepID=UPI0023E8EF78|nr:hypothetical protein [Halomicroarcula sp. ZS-22-S1]